MDRTAWQRLLIGRFSWQRLVRSTILIYLCLLIFAWFYADRMIFCPQPPSYTDTDEIVKLRPGNGATISALHLKHPDAIWTVLYNHANAVDLGDVRPFLEQFRDRLGVSVFAYDYQGYGTSTGRAGTRRACLDAETAFMYLVEDCGVSPDRIVVHGRSVGGGPALYVAERHDVAAVIVESSFVTAFRVLTHVPLTPFDRFRNIARIATVDCPVLVIHGTDDRVIPCWHGRALFRRATEPKQACWLPGADHNNIPPDAETLYWEAVARFVATLDSAPQHNAEPLSP